MPKKQYLVALNDDEREHLEHLLHGGTHAPRKVTVPVFYSKRPRAGRIALSLPPSLWGARLSNAPASALSTRG